MNTRPALDGIRVLDFTQNLPGPWATLVLASLGAEVIKVEPPAGDTARLTPELFEIVNAGKRSVMLDLKRDDEVARLHGLLGEVDVVVEGFRPGVMTRLGCDAAQVRARHPRLVYCSISGYGQSGPHATHPGHDLNFQALTGVCDLSRDREQHPLGAALPIADLSAAATAVSAILAALFARERHGVGATLDVAMVDTLLAWSHAWADGLTPRDTRLSETLSRVVGPRAGAAGLAGAAAGRLSRWLEGPGAAARVDAFGRGLRRTAIYRRLARLRLYALPHYGLFRTRDDRWLSIAIVDEDKFWRALCRGLALPAVAAVPLPLRFVGAAALRAMVARAVRRESLAHWLAHFDREQVPVAPVLRIADALADPQLAFRTAGVLSGAPVSLTHRRLGPAPRLGEHTVALLGARDY